MKTISYHPKLKKHGDPNVAYLWEHKKSPSPSHNSPKPMHKKSDSKSRKTVDEVYIKLGKRGSIKTRLTKKPYTQRFSVLEAVKSSSTYFASVQTFLGDSLINHNSEEAIEDIEDEIFLETRGKLSFQRDHFDSSICKNVKTNQIEIQENPPNVYQKNLISHNIFRDKSITSKSNSHLQHTYIEPQIQVDTQFYKPVPLPSSFKRLIAPQQSPTQQQYYSIISQQQTSPELSRLNNPTPSPAAVNVATTLPALSSIATNTSMRNLINTISTPFRQIIQCTDVNKTNKIQIIGRPLEEAFTRIYNKFMVIVNPTKSKLYPQKHKDQNQQVEQHYKHNQLSVALEGPSKPIINLKNMHKGYTLVKFYVALPGFYECFIRLNKINVTASPFVLNVKTSACIDPIASSIDSSILELSNGKIHKQLPKDSHNYVASAVSDELTWQSVDVDFQTDEQYPCQVRVLTTLIPDKCLINMPNLKSYVKYPSGRETTASCSYCLSNNILNLEFFSREAGKHLLAVVNWPNRRVKKSKRRTNKNSIKLDNIRSTISNGDTYSMPFSHFTASLNNNISSTQRHNQCNSPEGTCKRERKANKSHKAEKQHGFSKGGDLNSSITSQALSSNDLLFHNPYPIWIKHDLFGDTSFFNIQNTISVYLHGSSLSYGFIDKINNFTVEMAEPDFSKHNINVCIEGPSKSEMAYRKTKTGYSINYRPYVPGVYTITVQENGKELFTSPFMIRIFRNSTESFKSLMANSRIICFGKALMESYVHRWNYFYVQFVKNPSEISEITIQGEHERCLKVDYKLLKNWVYIIGYCPHETGNHLLSFKLKDNTSERTPYAVNVLA